MALADMRAQIDAFSRQSSETALEMRAELAGIKELLLGLITKKNPSPNQSVIPDPSGSSSMIFNRIPHDPKPPDLTCTTLSFRPVKTLKPQSEVLYSISKVFDEVKNITMESPMPSITVEDEGETDSMDDVSDDLTFLKEVNPKVTIIDDCISDAGILEVVFNEHGAHGEVQTEVSSEFIQNVATILNSNHTVHYSVRCSDLRLRTYHKQALPSFQENLILRRTCAEIYLMELEVPVGMWYLEEILWPPDATKFLVMCRKLITKTGKYFVCWFIPADISIILRIIEYYQRTPKENEKYHISNDYTSSVMCLSWCVVWVQNSIRLMNVLAIARTSSPRSSGGVSQQYEVTSLLKILIVIRSMILKQHCRWKISYVLNVTIGCICDELWSLFNKTYHDISLEWNTGEGLYPTCYINPQIYLLSIHKIPNDATDVVPYTTPGPLYHIATVSDDNMCKNSALQGTLYEYANLFEEPSALPPFRNGFNHKFPLLEGALHVHPYSSTSFAAQVVLVKKQDGSWRLCINYKGLNNQTIKDKYPIPLLEDLLDELGGSMHFSKLDLRAGFLQLRMTPADIYKTMFKIRSGHYEYLVMHFGLPNESCTFQGLMNHIFRNIARKFLLVFDDILIYSSRWKDHIQHLLAQNYTIPFISRALGSRHQALSGSEKELQAVLHAIQTWSSYLIYTLSPRFYGPFLVIDHLGAVAYKLELSMEAVIHNVFHMSQLKLCLTPPYRLPVLPHYLLDLGSHKEPEANSGLQSGEAEKYSSYKDTSIMVRVSGRASNMGILAGLPHQVPDISSLRTRMLSTGEYCDRVS